MIGLVPAVCLLNVFTNRDPGINEGWHSRFHCHCISDCICTGRWGAPSFYFFAPYWIPSTCCLENSLLPFGLTILDCIFLLLSVWVGIWNDTAFLDRDQAAGERIVYIFSQPQASTKIVFASLHSLHRITHGFYLRPWNYWYSTDRYHYCLITGTVIFWISAWNGIRTMDFEQHIASRRTRFDWPSLFQGMCWSGAQISIFSFLIHLYLDINTSTRRSKNISVHFSSQ